MRFDAGCIFDRANWPQHTYLRHMRVDPYVCFLKFAKELFTIGYSYDEILVLYFDKISEILDRKDLSPNEHQREMATKASQRFQNRKHVGEQEYQIIGRPEICEN